MSEPSPLDALWSRFADPVTLQTRPQARIDPRFYATMNPDVTAARVDPTHHFHTYGQTEGRHGTTYAQLRATWSALDGMLADLATAPEICAAFRARMPGIHEVFFELMLLGDPVDRRVSCFSARFYLTHNPDVARSGTIPFLHYLRHGIAENRPSLRHLRENQFPGQIPHDPVKPTLLIGLHEFSRTGAPIVGLDLARSAAHSHNVVIAGLRGGPLLDDLTAHAVCVIVTDSPDQTLPYIDHPALERIDRAVLNSVEAFPFAPFLVRHGIPWASYLHEYTDYIRPANKAVLMAAFSDLLVFSSEQVRQSWTGVMADVDADPLRDSIVLPQYPFRPATLDRASHEAGRRTLASLTGQDLTGRRVVVGAGHAQWRKGTDLFILTAQIAHARGDDSLYVWVGDGLNHEDMHFGVWLDKHMRAARANEPGSNLVFLPAGPHYRDVLRAADVFYLPSRLDPLPNVVFDAAASGCRIVIFAQGSGFDDPAYSTDPTLHVLPYGDIAAAASLIAALPHKTAGTTVPPATNATPVLPQILGALSQRLGNRSTPCRTTGDYDLPLLFPAGPEDADARAAARQKMWTCGRRLIWPDLATVQSEIARSDNWVHRHMRTARFACVAGGTISPFAVHIHAYHLDDLATDLSRYKALRAASRVVVTTDTRRKAAQISRIGQQAGLALEVIEMPNLGRDILPFLRLFCEGHTQTDPDAVWCHIHLKKSLATTATGDVWKRFLLTILLGDDQAVSDAVQRLSDPALGLVAALDPYRYGWAESRRLLPRFAGQFPAPLPAHPILFPIGNMFWTRARVANRMARIFGPGYPWPNEPLPTDGTEFHLIERLWPTVAAMEGLTSVFLEKVDQPRG